MFRPLKTRHLVTDLTVAAVAFLLRMALGAPVDGLGGAVFVVVLFGMASTVALHRWSPFLALIVAWVSVALQLTFLLPPDICNAAILLMLFGTGAYGSPAVKWAGLISSVFGAFLATAYVVAEGILSSTDWTDVIAVALGNLPRYGALFVGGFTAALALFTLSWALGLLLRSLRTARVSRAAQAQAEQEQEQAERIVAIEQERNRIARDMHDVVAHSLAVVIAQADGARYAMRTDPSAADAALGTISGTAREALGDVRILLGQLRHSQGEGPKPTLVDLDRLLEQMRSSGLSIVREQIGGPDPLGTAQQLAVYRIVQESLTNALRHGDTGEEVVVSFDWGHHALVVRVSNALGTVPGDRRKAGHGIDGMRERAILAGGNLETSAENGVFTVTATIPVVVTAPMAVIGA